MLVPLLQNNNQLIQVQVNTYKCIVESHNVWHSAVPSTTKAIYLIALLIHSDDWIQAAKDTLSKLNYSATPNYSIVDKLLSTIHHQTIPHACTHAIQLQPNHN